jgi:hypothetical protein
MRRGWINPAYRYLAERKQREILVNAAVDDRAIYRGKNDWPAFVRSLRPGDVAVVPELRVFASRKALGEAVAAVEAREAKLIAVVCEIPIDAATVLEVHRTEAKWGSERSMGKRAKAMSERGHAVRRKKLAASRMAEDDARAIWHDLTRYPVRAEAVEAMRGWTYTTAWRKFGPRELKLSK